MGFATFEDFWPFYVSQHRRRGTRTLHFAGTTLALICLARGLADLQPSWFAWGLLLGYGLAWIGHFFIEKNRPATFQYPIWSARGDFRMYGLMWRGRMSQEAARLDCERPAANAVN